MLGTWEIISIFLLILLIFGGKKIPEVARGLGKGLREFKKAKDDITDSITTSADIGEKTDQKTDDTASKDETKSEEGKGQKSDDKVKKKA